MPPIANRRTPREGTQVMTLSATVTDSTQRGLTRWPRSTARGRTGALQMRQ